MPTTAAFLARRARTLRTAAAGLTVVAAGITLTACGGNDASGVKSSGKAQSSVSATPTAGGPASQGGADAGAGGAARADGGVRKDLGGTGATGAAAKKRKGGAGGSEQEIGTCDLNKMAVSVTSVPRPVNHLLLKVTNGAGVDCHVPGFPLLRFDEAHAPTPAAEETKPQAVVTLAPGESAYAGITTAAADGSGSDGVRATKVTVSLSGLDIRTTVDLPGDSVHIDSSSQVTYWQSDTSDALSW